MDTNSKEIVDLNENYVYNDMLARALVQLLPQEERPHITMWLEKLQSISGDEKTLTTRNDYTWLLLLAMQSGKIAEPFDELPPTKDLPPISDIMPPHLFREMFGSTERDLCWIDDLIADTNAATDDQGSPSNCIPPHKFLELQPKPINGVTCYFSLNHYQVIDPAVGPHFLYKGSIMGGITFEPGRDPADSGLAAGGLQRQLQHHFERFSSEKITL